MKDAPPPLLDRARRKLRRFSMKPRLRQYLEGIGAGHPLAGVPTRIVGDASADPTEFFDHYDAFAFWAARHCASRGGRLRILDVGSPKMMNAMLSAQHDVTALVLADCGDRLSSVHYVRHDVGDPLPFEDASFDVFTSTVSLPLVGLGRYGDRLDGTCLPRLVSEIGRVLEDDGEWLISMCLGPDVLNFNNGWFLEMPTMQRLFSGWDVSDRLVDLASSPRGNGAPPEPRFTADTSTARIAFGDYRVVFLHLQRPR